ncbi:hypothetical protein LIER_42489 [Lithospermum erythrorhizon]|uniref:Secreted protein n=1 Tax=Lithospermum erythrorhizon TaxID=34254 RepID=A0AAV3RS94_LITER
MGSRHGLIVRDLVQPVPLLMLATPVVSDPGLWPQCLWVAYYAVPLGLCCPPWELGSEVADVCCCGFSPEIF